MQIYQLKVYEPEVNKFTGLGLFPNPLKKSQMDSVRTQNQELINLSF